MNLKYISILTILFFSINSFSQNTFNSTNSSGAKLVGDFVSREMTTSEKMKNIQGTMYVTEQFLPARIINSKNKETLLLRYNAYTDNMEVKELDGDKVGILLKDSNKFIIEIIKDKTIYKTYDYFDENNNSKRSFFISLVDNNRVSLLKKQRIEFHEEQPAKTSYDQSEPARFSDLDEIFYVKIGKQNPIELPRNKRKIAELFPKYENNIKKYIKKNNLKTSKEADLIKLFKYISEL